MKKGIFAILAILLVSAIAMTGCDTDSSPKKVTPNNVTITFSGNGNTGGTAPGAQTVPANTEITLPGAGNLVKTGSVFGGWNTNAGGTGTNYDAGAKYIAAATATLHAKWTTSGGSATVTFDGNGNTGGTAPTAMSSTVGGKITLPGAGTLVKTGSTFGGWNTQANGSGTTYAASAEFTVTAAQVTLYAVWSVSGTTATVTFTGNGNTGGTAPQAITSTVGGSITLPGAGSLVKTGSSFGGWSTDPNATSGAAAGSTYQVGAATVTLHAVWIPSIRITFDANKPAGYTGQTPIVSDPVNIAVGGKLTAAQLASPTGLDADLVFVGWFKAADGNDAVTVDTVFNAAATIFAHWNVVNLDTQVVITFDLNYADASPKTFEKIFPKNAAAGDLWPEDPTRPDDPVGGPWVFTGWWINNYGTQTSYDSTSAFGDAQIIYAGWELETPLTEEPPSTVDLTGAEKVTLENSWYVVYKFELPTGKTWADYSGISADYMVPPSVWNGDGSRVLRGVRLMGNYVASDFTLITMADSAEAVMPARMVASYNNDKNAPYIFDDPGFNGAFQNYATQLGVDGPWKWFTYTYRIDGSRKNSNYVASHQPVDTSTGPYYFGIGLTGQGGGGNTSYIKNVNLVGQTGTPNVPGVPLWIRYDNGTGDQNYPAFTGYPTTGGPDGSKQAWRGMVDGSQPAPVVIQATVTFNYNYTDATEPYAVKKILKGYALGDTNFPADPEREGFYFFQKWTKDAAGTGDAVLTNEVFTEDTQLYAQWTAETVDVTLDANYIGAPAGNKITIGKGGSLSSTQLAPLTRTGYRFDTWTSTAASGGTAITTATQFTTDTTIYAQWVETVAVTFNLNYSGSTAIVKNPDKGQAITDFPATATWNSYYTFASWNTRADGKGIAVTSATKFNAATTVYAIWKAKVLAPADLVYLSTDALKGDVNTIRTPKAAAIDSNYATNSALQWSVASMGIPAGFDLSAYKAYTIKVKAYSNATTHNETTEIDLSALAINTNVLQFKFSRSATSMGDGDMIDVLYNIGSKSDGVPQRIYGEYENFTNNVLNSASPVLGMFLQGGGVLAANGVKYVEITEVIFYTALSGAVAVNLETLEDPIFGSIPNQTWNVSKGDLTITAPAYDTYRWTINGAQQTAQSRALTLKVSDYTGKIDTNITVTVLGFKGSNAYSKTVVIAVKR